MLQPPTRRSAAAMIAVVLALVFTSMQLSATAQTPAASPAYESDATFTEAPCTAEINGPFVEGETWYCGSVDVPAFHAEPEGERFDLNVIVLKSTSESPAEEPLVILTGGPGQSLDAVLPLFSDDFPLYQPLLERQDVILFDQRGTGQSDPALSCPVDALLTATPDPEAADAESTPALDATAYQDQLLACGDQLREKGIDLDAFNSTESAADVADIAAALGEPQVDLYGISYGSYLGLTVMRDHPDVVRSAILSSPLPLEAEPLGGQTIAFSESLEKVFAACNEDEECAAAFPNLEEDFSTVIAQLSDEPMVVDVQDPATGETYPIPVDAPTFTQVLYLSVFVGQLIPAVPPLISATAAGDTSILASILPIVLSASASAGTSSGVLYTMFCNEEAPYTSPEQIEDDLNAAGVLPELSGDAFSGIGTLVYPICEAWDIDGQPTNQNEPVASDIPTLVVTGAFDPITPPAYGEMLMDNLSNATLVDVPNQGHDPLTNIGDCGLTVIDTFLDDPAAGPDDSCVAELALDLTPEMPASPEASPAS